MSSPWTRNTTTRRVPLKQQSKRVWLRPSETHWAFPSPTRRCWHVSIRIGVPADALFATAADARSACSRRA